MVELEPKPSCFFTPALNLQNILIHQEGLKGAGENLAKLKNLPEILSKIHIYLKSN